MVVLIFVAGASMALTWDWISAFQSTPDGLVVLALVVVVVVVGVVVDEVELLTVICHILEPATGRLRTADPRRLRD
jgi:hypothetical protein